MFSELVRVVNFMHWCLCGSWRL